MLQESAFILFNGNTEGTHVFAFLYHIYSSLLMQDLIAVCRRSEIFFVFLNIYRTENHLYLIFSHILSPLVNKGT